MIVAGISASLHAVARLQQRSIPETVVAWILDHGEARRRHGADVYALDHRGRRKLRREIGDALYRHLAPLLNTYVVVGDDGVLVTAAPRLRRIKTARRIRG